MTRFLLLAAAAALTIQACSAAPTREVDRPANAPCGSEVHVKVSATANIFGAGVEVPPAPGGGGGGVGPECVAVPDGTATVSIARARGSVAFTPLRAPDTHFHKCPGGREAVLAQGPDGNPGGCPGDLPGGTIVRAGLVSGIASADRVGFLVGVFLPAGVPNGAPPPSLDFEGNYDFARLSPELAQLFFIGDGRASDGSLQRFDVPDGATRLFLGIADAFGFSGHPGSFDDNTGSFRVDVLFG